MYAEHTHRERERERERERKRDRGREGGREGRGVGGGERARFLSMMCAERARASAHTHTVKP